MRNHPVHWCDGLFLVPQHFQAADRHWSEVLQKSEYYDHEYNYGLRHLEYSQQAIANLHFQVDACNARTKEGTLIALGQGEEPERVSLREAVTEPPPAKGGLAASLADSLQRHGEVTVYLGLPKFRWGAANVGRDAGVRLCRYRETQLSLQDESFGGNDQVVGKASDYGYECGGSKKNLFAPVGKPKPECWKENQRDNLHINRASENKS